MNKAGRKAGYNKVGLILRIKEKKKKRKKGNNIPEKNLRNFFW